MDAPKNPARRSAPKPAAKPAPPARLAEERAITGDDDDEPEPTDAERTLREEGGPRGGVPPGGHVHAHGRRPGNG